MDKYNFLREGIYSNWNNEEGNYHVVWDFIIFFL